MIGWLSGVASLSSSQIFIDLSHSAVIIRRPDLSNMTPIIAASDWRLPGWRGDFIYWNIWPESQSYIDRTPLSLPLTSTLSLFKAIEFMIELWPAIVRRWWPSGHFQIRILSAAPLAKVYSVGWITRALTPFLWCVNVCRHVPVLTSQVFIILSCEPVIICGSSF